MKKLHETAKFSRDLRKAERGANRRALRNLGSVIRLLASGSPLPPEFRDHGLTGNWGGYRECHVAPDLLLIYQDTPAVLYLVRLGSHSELFH